MPVLQRLYRVAAIALGYGLIIAGGLTAFYVTQAFQKSNRTLIGAAAAVAVLVGVLVIVKVVPRIGDWCDSTDDVHIPGFDVEVEQPPNRITEQPNNRITG